MITGKRHGAFLLSLVAFLACAKVPDDVPPLDERPPPDESRNLTASNIKHVVVIIQENHTFDNHFGAYCKAAPGSNPSCNAGPSCCEAAPDKDPGTGIAPAVLTDEENGKFNPNHQSDCELDEIHDGKMDQFVSSMLCGKARNFSIAPEAVVKPYWELARSYALGDRFFQPVVGASASNNMYLARATFVFPDNQYAPDSVGVRCDLSPPGTMQYTDRTLGDLLGQRSVPWAFYIEGYQPMLDAQKMGKCPAAPADCPSGIPLYPCIYDPSDIPFQYYTSFRDNPTFMRDFEKLDADLKNDALPPVSFVKGLGYKSEHPGSLATISDGAAFVTGVVNNVLASRYAKTTLILVLHDEGGGYFDHVPPPPKSAIDGQSYGTRVPFLALGSFARKNYVSHVTMEHSSIVKFIEWNWLDKQTGQLGTRDTVVNNLGSMLDPTATGMTVPEQ